MAKTTEQILTDVKKTSKISEADLNLLLRRKNAGEKFDDSIFWDSEILVTDAQFNKGKKWLNDLYKTPNGKERKTNPFGYREQLVLETIQSIRVKGFYDAGNFFRSFYVPLYEVNGTNTSMEYYMSAGKINIIG